MIDHEASQEWCPQGARLIRILVQSLLKYGHTKVGSRQQLRYCREPQRQWREHSDVCSRCSRLRRETVFNLRELGATMDKGTNLTEDERRWARWAIGKRDDGVV